MSKRALRCPRLFDGEHWHDQAILLIEKGLCCGIVGEDDVPPGYTVEDAGGHIVAPGFVDAQVNGGGGVLFNDQPSLEGIRTICAAHARFGTTALLPTLITDTPEITAKAVQAARKAAQQHVPGFAGLHLEGPHLSVARKGAHHADLIRPMTAEDLTFLRDAKDTLSVLLVTLAPEAVSTAQIEALAAAQIIVSLGHSDCSYDSAAACARSGAHMVTHLFNAMSPMSHRAPGLVGAALDTDSLHAGIIADGIHVAPSVLRIALRAKAGPGRIFLVTDAMASIGTDLASFQLNGRTVHRRGGRLTLDDGTLAGADIDMAASVRFIHRTVGLPLETALAMASLDPASALNLAPRKGMLTSGADADIVVLDENLQVAATWIGGNCVHAA